MIRKNKTTNLVKRVRKPGHRRLNKALAIFREKVTLRTREAASLGIDLETLYYMRNTGVITQISRGFFRASDAPEAANLDWIIVTEKSPKSVICLLSALAFHDITDHIPNEIYIALPRDVKPPKLSYPPIKAFHFSDSSYEAGIEVHTLDGKSIKIYCPEKTVVDCFRFRNKIGLEIAISALKLCIEKFKSRPADFLKYARVCGVEKIILPYLEALG